MCSGSGHRAADCPSVVRAHAVDQAGGEVDNEPVARVSPPDTQAVGNRHEVLARWDAGECGFVGSRAGGFRNPKQPRRERAGMSDASHKQRGQGIRRAGIVLTRADSRQVRSADSRRTGNPELPRLDHDDVSCAGRGERSKGGSRPGEVQETVGLLTRAAPVCLMRVGRCCREGRLMGLRVPKPSRTWSSWAHFVG